MPHQLKSHPRKNGKDSRACRITGRTLGLVRKYELMLCRQAFREQAEHIGFVKYR
jgi:small subunit ribosomal protein S29e